MSSTPTPLAVLAPLLLFFIDASAQETMSTDVAGEDVAAAVALPARDLPPVPLDERTWLDTSIPIPGRVEALIAAMALEEKAAQMMATWQKNGQWVYDAEADLALRPDSLARYFPHGIGQVTRPSEAAGGTDAATTVELTNRIQRYFIEQTRLGIPVIFHEESLHGLASAGGTSFPQPIALAGSFDTALVRRIYDRASAETRSRGGHQVLSPVLDICRDPRWGRVEETYGEDPHVAASTGAAAVRGFQGGRDYDGADSMHVIATLKHLTGHGVPESGTNIGPTFIAERQLREVFMRPFERVIAAERPGALMASYNEIDGVPSHANRWMLVDVLRDEWGFEGFVVSDYFALRELATGSPTLEHRLARDDREAAALGIDAGVNIELPNPDVYLAIPALVRDGIVEESRLDELLRPMLAAKFELGLFERPYRDPARAIDGDASARALAREAGAKSIALLQNDDARLPLDPAAGLRIAAVGPNMDRQLLGGYSGKPNFNVTVLDGLREAFGADKVTYAEGVGITTTSGWAQDSVAFPTEADDRAGIAEAVAAAAAADVIVVAIGGNEQTSREAWAKTHLGDRPTLQLVGRQNELIDALAATGKPIVALLFGGRPLAIQNVLDKSDAVLQCWYLGQETGGAVADVLTGAVNPSAKLAISMPRSAGHIPVYYAAKPSARRGYLADETSALFPFGHGLSYTTFEVGAPVLPEPDIAPGDDFAVEVEVANTGEVAGAEVVQVYVRDEFASVTRPVRQLVGFRRVELAPGERQTVSIPVRGDDLGLYDRDMVFGVEPGEFTVFAGTSSRLEDLQSTTLRVGME